MTQTIGKGQHRVESLFKLRRLAKAAPADDENLEGPPSSVRHGYRQKGP